MDDKKIIELYWARSENAIEETANKYGSYCYSIANNILANPSDAEESVNDTYMNAWNSIPPHAPKTLSTFLGKITRRVSIDRWRKRNADKRGGGEMPLALDELNECISDKKTVETEIERKLLSDTINKFIGSLPNNEQKVFVRRYWYMDSINDICKRYGYSESKTKSMLFRTRDKLHVLLKKEGYI